MTLNVRRGVRGHRAAGSDVLTQDGCATHRQHFIDLNDGGRTPFSLRLLHKLRLQLHGTETLDLAVYVVIAFDQTNALDLGAGFND
jgi:hypothetical protein